MSKFQTLFTGKDKMNANGPLLGPDFNETGVKVNYLEPWDKNKAQRDAGKTQRAYFTVNESRKMLNLSKIMTLIHEDASLKDDFFSKAGDKEVFAISPEQTFSMDFEKGNVKSLKLLGQPKKKEEPVNLGDI
jgi:hypothetical protein